MKRVDFLRLVERFTVAAMNAVTAFFIAATGGIIAGFAIAVPTLDVVPQALSLIKAGWLPSAAWAFSVGTSALPLVYSFTRESFPVRGRGVAVGVLYHVLFWSIRVMDAVLDTMGVGVISGATDYPTLAYLLHANAFQIITAVVMFVLSNVTDELKTAIVGATQQYVAFVREVVSQGARQSRPRPQTRARSQARPARSNPWS